MARAFGKIALTLSGGGARAVGFHLGTLSFLDYAKYYDTDESSTRSVLEDVALLSTVSGGTLVGLGYAASLKQGKPFGQFYSELETAVELNRLLAGRLLPILGAASPPSPSGRRYLVSAYARIYKSFPFFSEERFEIFWDNAPTHIEELVVNTTDFYHGFGFRFQYGSLSGESGNRFCRIDEEFAKQILLSDIMATSSDHPVLFEPLVFPDDFRWPGDPSVFSGAANRDAVLGQIQDAIADQMDARSLVLMDGGIFDNQGLTNILDWIEDDSGSRDDRRNLFRRFLLKEDHAVEVVTSGNWSSSPLGTEFGSSPGSWWSLPRSGFQFGAAPASDEVGLVFVSDSPMRQYDGAIYEMNEKRPRWNISLRKIAWANYIFLGVALISLSAIAVRFLASSSTLSSFTFWDWIIYGTPVVVLAGVFIVLVIATVRLWRAMRTCRQVSGSVWPFIRALTVCDLSNMISLRGLSTLAAVDPILTARKRDLTYKVLKNHPGIHKDSIVTNEIHDLIEQLPNGLPVWLDPSSEMRAIARDVATMENKLWMSRQEMRDLVACGHFTTCYNLVAQLWLNESLYPRLPDDTFEIPEQQELFEHLHSAWTQMQADPRVFVPNNS